MRDQAAKEPEFTEVRDRTKNARDSWDFHLRHRETTREEFF
jgi:hypothetical protein